ncbi:hypothetical protein HF324_12365 [Chitinophaga oryzae]|uniref:Uncharacterized protein n=1 Tax=Chitinophaga oryzae TaxID=2725414 RepID=A0AAE6ZHY7_9BACT|nr:hypothetical protein [Chitinophaga oryzae]QJB32139.1 hypothetical protein HF329_12700 [Chitinophaga oryzae]QJB38615.1 hypothetical protein HF324_12365 [Chitinophaga oryzae]
MPDFSMAGKWCGYYILGQGYSDALFGKKVKFELELHDIGNEEFEGRCTDFYDKPAPQAMVKGYIENDFINFIKEYDGPFTSSVENPTTTWTPPINYTGYYDAAQETFFGEWEHMGDTHETPLGTYTEGCAGIWNMKKVAS